MKSIDKVEVELAVVLGTTAVPIQQLLRMGRGALIELDSKADDDVAILANNVAVARGKVLLRGDRIHVSVTEVLGRGLAAAKSGQAEAPHTV